MRQRLLGWKTALRVSDMALGCGLLGATQDGPDAEVARAMLCAFAERGGTLIDTSSAHQGGRSEELVGRFLAEAGRDRFVISTKYGRLPNGDAKSLAGGSHPRAMLAQVEASLRRLGTDRIDLYAVEFPDGVTPVEEIVRGLDMLVRQGKIVAFALSNFAAWQIAHAATLADLRGWAPLSAIHYQYNLVERTAEREHLPMADAFGLGVLAWSPQARGGLARETLDGVPSEIAAAVRTVATERGLSVGAVALAWLLAKGAVPVVGARSVLQLVPSLDAADVRLADDDVVHLDRAMSTLHYPDRLLAQMRAGIGVDEAMLEAAHAATR